MKILFIEWASFGNEDIKEAFTAEGHTLACFPFSNKDGRKDAEIETELTRMLNTETPDVVFSFNYFPVISQVCKKEGIKYIPGSMTALMSCSIPIPLSIPVM